MRFASFSMTPRRAGAVAGLIAFLIIGGYTISVSLPLLEGPRLVITEPKGGVVEGAATVAGVTERVSFLSIDGLPVPVTEDGSFSVKRAYPAGYTEVTVQAKDRFGRERTKSISFITLPRADIGTSTASTTIIHGPKEEN